ncbi:MAG TPA: bifunctional DNA primase/polymerase [Candidatus Limnocylindrales bacterium]|nr:bifunctional DNA primase/polymerase [Candidatus Limnocylindrales bacterium]
MSAVLTAALGYATAGWPVFLLGRSKRPLANCPNCPKEGQPGAHDPQGCKCLTCHGFYAATLDPRAIRRMLALTPRSMLAIRTGAASGLVVVDVDPAKGGLDSLTDMVKRGLCPPTRFVRTGNGGWHLYYRHPGPHMKIPGSNGKLAAGIDIKADGGYVAAPPSIHPDTRNPYAWADPHAPMQEMAPALRAACLEPELRPARAAAAASTTTLAGRGAIPHPDRLLAALLDRVRTAQQGRRRNTLYGCARGVARMAAAGAITATDGQTALLTACQQAGWDINAGTHAAITGGFRDEGVTL